MSKPPTETSTETESRNSEKSNISIMGVALFFVVASIVYSTTAIVRGTEGWVNLVMVTPQALFALYVTIVKFANNKQGVQ